MDREELLRKIHSAPDGRLSVYLVIGEDRDVKKVFFSFDDATAFKERLVQERQQCIREATLSADGDAIRIQGDQLVNEIASPHAIIPALLGIDEPQCTCLTRSSTDLDRKYVGTDLTNGRYGDVHIEQCRNCGRIWLHYFVEYEAFTGSGRWYCGLVMPEIARAVTPENAVEILKELDWHFYGGSYFGQSGWSSFGVYVDL